MKDLSCRTFTIAVQPTLSTSAKIASFLTQYLLFEACLNISDIHSNVKKPLTKPNLTKPRPGYLFSRVPLYALFSWWLTISLA